jgi:predicted dehydrogenase
MLNVAILSGWHVHADGYANEFSKMPDVKLTVMWDEVPERGAQFAQKYGMEYMADLDALLGRADVDAVCVTTPTNLHPEVIIKAAKAGKHIFTEKVLALTAADAYAIKKAVSENGVKFCISYPHRTQPHNLFAKDVVEKGLLGQLTLTRVRNAHAGASAGWLPPHFYDEAQTGGGAMMDLGAHPMYLIHWLMGKPMEITSAFTSVTGKAVEDNAVSLLSYADGAVAVSETGFVSSVSPYSLELYGTEGSLLINRGGINLNYKKDGVSTGWTAVEKEQLPEPLPGPIAQFVDGVVNDKPIAFGIDDAVALTEIMEAAYRSAKEGKHIKL